MCEYCHMVASVTVLSQRRGGLLDTSTFAPC
jgi:hypothetical protein